MLDYLRIFDLSHMHLTATREMTFALFLKQWRERNEAMVARAQQAKAGVNLPLEKRTA